MKEHAPSRPAVAGAAADDPAWLDAVLGVVRARSGVDFAGYRRGTLLRRVHNRMISAGTSSPAAYLERVREQPGEVGALLERLTIKVSRFWRSAAAFEAVRRALLARRAAEPGRALSAWSAGCGNGEEAYSLAMLLAEVGQRSGGPDVLATDVDRGALARAVEGVYARPALVELPPALLERYLEAAGGPERWRVRPELRARVTFRPHDLGGGEPPPGGRRFDLVACRNVLIYLAPPLQRGVLALLADRLLPGGLLWLGEAEWPAPELAARFTVLDRKGRLFELRTGTSGGRTR